MPAWVREMDDDTPYMELVRANAQGELSALERGIHALGATEKGKHGKSVNAYATQVGRAEATVRLEVRAAEVANSHTCENFAILIERHRHLAEIYPAPRWLWPALLEKLVAGPRITTKTNSSARP